MMRGAPSRVDLKHSDLGEYEAAKAAWKKTKDRDESSDSAMTPSRAERRQHDRIGLTQARGR